MEITRKFDDGTELRIQLTVAEVDQAYRIRRKYYNKCDLLCRINQLLDLEEYSDKLMVDDDKEYEIGNRTATGKQLRELIDNGGWLDNLAEDFGDALDRNDGYWESFWMTAEEVIENAIDRDIPKSEKELKQASNLEKYEELIMDIRRSPLPWDLKEEIIGKLINEGV